MEQDLPLPCISLDQRAVRHLPGGLIRFDLAQRHFVAVAGMTQKMTPSTGMQYSLEVNFELARS
jgi:hypothetical protein